MATKPRTYGDRCGIARALDVVGERWALLVVRELLLGPKRFSDLRTGLPRVSPDVLAQRLRELEAAGLLERRTLPPPAASKVYALTERGRELRPVVQALGRWGSQAPSVLSDAPLGTDALAVALDTLFDPARADGLALSVVLRIGGDAFHAAVRDAALAVTRGEPASAEDDVDATIEAEPGPLARVLWHEGDPSELAITGDRRAAERFLGLFPLPGS